MKGQAQRMKHMRTHMHEQHMISRWHGHKEKRMVKLKPASWEPHFGHPLFGHASSTRAGRRPEPQLRRRHLCRAVAYEKNKRRHIELRSRK